MPILFAATLLMSATGTEQVIPRHEFPVSRTEAVLSSRVVCSSGLTSSVTVNWSKGTGLSITAIASNRRNIPTSEVRELSSAIPAATDVRYIESWCSGDRDVGVRIHFSKLENNHFLPFIAEFQVQPDKLSKMFIVSG